MEFNDQECSSVEGSVSVERNGVGPFNQIVCENQEQALRLAHMAKHNGNMTILRLLLGKLPREGEGEGLGESVLHRAVRENKPDIIPELIRRGEDPNAVDVHGRSPLIWALMNGHIDTVKMLVNIGCDVNSCDTQGNTPLLMGIRLGCEEIVDLLLDAGAEVQDRYGKNTALHESIGRYASLKIIKKLVDKGEKCLDTVNDHGVTPLLLAISQASIHAVKLLLIANVKVNYEARIMSYGYHNSTPLQHCLHQILLPLAQQITSPQVTKKRVRNQMLILSMLLIAGTKWHGHMSELSSLIIKIKTYLRQLYNDDDFSLTVCYQLDEAYTMLSTPRSLLEICKHHIRSSHGSNITTVVKTVPFAPYFQDFILLRNLDNIVP